MSGRIPRALSFVVIGAMLAALWAADASAQAAASKGAPAVYKPDQRVEAREGDEWSPATVIKREGRKYQIRYEDGTEEWVATDRLRAPGAAAPAAGGAKAPAKPAAGKGAAPGKPKDAKPKDAKPKESFKTGAKVEVKWASSWKPATVKNRDGDLYLVIYDGWDHQMHW